MVQNISKTDLVFSLTSGVLLMIHHRFTELFNLLFVDGNPAGVKSMLNAMGMIENKLRLPLVPTRITTFEAIRKVLNELNIKC